MSSDRELLELAAKAAGHKLRPGWRNSAEGIFLGRGCDGDLYRVWNPRDDDGDCDRMEAAAGLNVYWNDDSVHVGKFGGDLSTEYFHPKRGDKQAARRLASLRAAAAIWRDMP